MILPRASRYQDVSLPGSPVTRPALDAERIYCESYSKLTKRVSQVNCFHFEHTHVLMSTKAAASSERRRHERHAIHNLADRGDV